MNTAPGPLVIFADSQAKVAAPKIGLIRPLACYDCLTDDGRIGDVEVECFGLFEMVSDELEGRAPTDLLSKVG
jgi:hypothetical protein